MNSRKASTFARALFDNVAEIPRELSFKKGDILTVLQEKYEDNSEWWICSLRNMVGLAPANRLEAMPVLQMERKPGFQSQISASLYDELPDHMTTSEHSYSNIPRATEVKERFDDEYSTYQLPNDDLFSFPLSKIDSNTEVIKSQTSVRISSLDDTYLNLTDPRTPPTYSNVPDGAFSEYHSNRVDYSDYFSDGASASHTDTTGSSLHSVNQCSISSSESGEFKYLPFVTGGSVVRIGLSPDDAINKYRQIHNETTNNCNRVKDFAKPRWTTVEMLRSNIQSIQSAFIELNISLLMLNAFAFGVLENARNCGDETLKKKLNKHYQILQDAQLTVKESIDKLETMNWDVDKIATSVRLAVKEGGDCLSRVVSAARNVLIQTRSLSVTINGNSTVLFVEQPRRAEPVSRSSTLSESLEDKTNATEIIRLFGQQVMSQIELVNQTVDEFISILWNTKYNTHSRDSIISNSKFVVRSGTQLVCIAKNLTDSKIKSVPNQKVEQAGNQLCDTLKSVVNCAKLFLTEEISPDLINQMINILQTVKSNSDKLQSIVVIATS